MTLKLHEIVCKLSQIWLICIPARFSVASSTDIKYTGVKNMSDVVKHYIRYVIFQKNAVGLLPYWASFPTFPYMYLILRL